MIHELLPGDPEVIGPYRLRGRLGGGGMGQVFLGFSPDGQPAAVKVIRADLAADAEFRARFRREAAVAQKVSSQFTVPVLDAGLDGPVPWLATAYVSGPSRPRPRPGARHPRRARRRRRPRPRRGVPHRPPAGRRPRPRRPPNVTRVLGQ